MRLRTALRSLMLAAGLVGAFATPASAEEKSLLAADGTLYSVRSGLATELGLENLQPDDYGIRWTAQEQNGTIRSGVVPRTTGRNIKKNLDVAWDEATASLLLIWKEELSILNVLKIGVFRDGSWIVSDLLPNLGFAHAFNPQMRLSHFVVRTTDPDGTVVSCTRSVLSVIWWEEAQYTQARYAPIFLDEENFDFSNVPVYDLPVLAGGGGATSYEEVSAGAYLFPSLHSDGPGGAILANFADLHSGKNVVVRITFPTDLGRPDASNITWMRRHIPIVGVVGESPIAPTAPERITSMGTTLGAGYRPTFYWRDGDRLLYTRFDGREWASTKAIPITENMSYERALTLVVGMAASN